MIKLYVERNSNTIVDMYNYYLDNYDYKIDYKTYRNIVSNFFKLLTDNLIGKGKTVKLPFELGYLTIVKSKKWFNTGKWSVDFKTSKELNKRVYHLNEHSDGYKYICHWSKMGSQRVVYMSKYRFVMTRANKRRLAQIIFNKERDYIEK